MATIGNCAQAGLARIARVAVSHRRDLMRKLKLHNAADVTRFAIRHGLVRGD